MTGLCVGRLWALEEGKCSFWSVYKVLNVTDRVEGMGGMTPLGSCTVGSACTGSLVRLTWVTPPAPALAGAKGLDPSGRYLGLWLGATGRAESADGAVAVSRPHPFASRP
jgi:hypothetical protein